MDNKPQNLLEWKELIQDSIGEYESTSGPVFTEKDDVEEMAFVIMADECPYTVTIRRAPTT